MEHKLKCAPKTILHFIISKREKKFNVHFLNIFYILRFFDEKIISLDILFVNTVEKIGAIKILTVLERKIGENNRFFPNVDKSRNIAYNICVFSVKGDVS